MPDLPTGTVTFLFTDIEGSTRLWEQYPQVMRIALAHHDALLREAIEQHNGYVFKTVGDAFCAAFPITPDALKAALSAQCLLQAQTWEGIGALRVRMALHTGAAEERANDYFGPALNRVARLLAIGHGEQVLLSSSAEELVQDSLPEKCRLQDLGSHRLKDLQQPEHVFQLLHPALPADFPSLRSLQAFANNLPIQLTSFIGREKEIEAVKSLLASTRLLTLTGSGGSGKTRLALQVAADLVEAYPDGVWLVELAALSEGSLAPQSVASTLGLREQAGRSLIETVTDYLRARTLLLVLDNCEHLVQVCARFADMLLRSCPQMKVIATSRERLRIAGEQTYLVPSLSLPDPKLPVEPESLIHSEAVCLFLDRARLSQPEFALTSENASAVSSVCSHLDGIPLALELAAARAGSMTVEEIISRLDNRFRLLKGGSRTALPRQQTLRALIDWSYDLLNNQERQLLNRLSVFRGGWTLEAAEQVCAGEEIEEWEVLDLLTSLVDKSLVIAERQESNTRYRLLETIRQYGQERLAESEERAALQKRHWDYFLALAETAEPQLSGSEQAEWLERLETEHDNLRTALEGSLQEGRGAEQEHSLSSSLKSQVSSLSLAVALWRFWYIRGYLSEGRAYLAEALAAKRSSERTKLHARALNGAGGLAWDQGDYTAARAQYEESLIIFRELGDKRGIAQSLHNLGLVASDQGDYATARTQFEECLSIFRELGDQQGIAYSLNGLGGVVSSQGDYATARSLYEECLAIQREQGNRQGIGGSLHNLGLVTDAQGDYATARAQYEESLIIFRELGDKRGISNSLNGLGSVARNQGNYATARSLYEQSLAIRRELGDKRGIASSLNNLGIVASERGNYDKAESLYEESLAIQRELGDKQGIAASFSNLGNVALVKGNYDKAESLYEERLAIGRELGDRLGIAYSLEAFANLAAVENQPKHAARLWGAAATIREVIGSPLPPREREEYDQNVGAIREALGEEAFATAWAEGLAMSMEQAIEYALQGDQR